jgi:putative transposase
VTERVKNAEPELDETDLWQAVSHDEEERAAWTHRQQRRKVVARRHERARWKREDFAHQHSRRIVNEFDVIALEDLNVTSMVQNRYLAKSIHDAAWSQFRELIACKAAWADRRYITVNPAHTSQDCSGCGNRNMDLTLADRVYRCVCCGLVIDRDLNASRNILAVGRHCLGLAP